jgi:hypothetical protein
MAAARSMESSPGERLSCSRSERISLAPWRTTTPPSRLATPSASDTLPVPASISVGGPVSDSNRSFTSSRSTRLWPDRYSSPLPLPEAALRRKRTSSSERASLSLST